MLAAGEGGAGEGGAGEGGGGAGEGGAGGEEGRVMKWNYSSESWEQD